MPPRVPPPHVPRSRGPGAVRTFGPQPPLPSPAAYADSEADAVSLAETVAINVSAAQADPLALADAAALAASLAAADPVSLADAAAGASVLAPTDTLPLAEATAADVSLAAADAAALADSSADGETLTVSDSATLAEATAADAALSVADTVAVADNAGQPALLVSYTIDVADTLALVEDVEVTFPLAQWLGGSAGTRFTTLLESEPDRPPRALTVSVADGLAAGDAAGVVLDDSLTRALEREWEELLALV